MLNLFYNTFKLSVFGQEPQKSHGTKYVVYNSLSCQRFFLLANNKKTMAADKQFQRADTLEYEDLPKTVGQITL